MYDALTTSCDAFLPELSGDRGSAPRRSGCRGFGGLVRELTPGGTRARRGVAPASRSDCAQRGAHMRRSSRRSTLGSSVGTCRVTDRRRRWKGYGALLCRQRLMTSCATSRCADRGRMEETATELKSSRPHGSRRGSGRGASSAGRRSVHGRCSHRRSASWPGALGRPASGVAVRCPACGKVSVNLVSRAHIDVPFVNDRVVGVVAHLFADDVTATRELSWCHDELWSGSFDARRHRDTDSFPSRQGSCESVHADT